MTSASSSVAVVIAVRNGAPFIVEAVRSGLRQPEVERIVVVDDGSSDGTPELIEGLGESRLLLLRNPGRGVSSARNFGAGHAGCDWIIFLDADDRLTEGAAAALLAAVSAEAIVAAYGDYERIDAGGHAIGRRRLMRAGRQKPSGTVLGDLIRSNFIINGGVVLVRRQAFEAVGGFAPELSIAEDWHLWCKLAALGPFSYVARRVMDYRVHGSSVMMGRQRMFEDFLPTLDRIFGEPAVVSGFDAATRNEARREAEVSVMTYCAAQALRNGARGLGAKLTLDAIRHLPRKAPYVLLRVAGAAARL